MKKHFIKFNLLVLLSLLLNFGKLYGQSVSFIDDRSGVEIIFKTPDLIFPQSWYDSPSDAKVKFIETDEDIIRSLKIVKKALAKYPVDVLKNNLKKVYVLYDLRFYNVGYGGTYWEDNVYITNQGLSNA